MLKWRMFLIFSAVTLLIMGGVHAYVYLRTVAETSVPAPWDSLLALGFLAAVVAVPLSLLAGRVLDRNLARFLVVPVYTWLGFLFSLLTLLLALDALRLLGWVAGAVTGVGPLGPGRSLSLEIWRVLAWGAVGLALLLTVVGVWWALNRLAVRRIEIGLRGLPPEMDGFTIAQLSDLHLDLVHGKRWLASVVERTNALRPDLVAVTGDLAEGTVAQFRDDVQPLRDLRAPHGIFFVTGNHEYFYDLAGWLRLLEEMGVRTLRNERVPIGPDGRGFDLAGVDDHDGRRIQPGHGPDLARALEGKETGRPVVLLAHQPRIVAEAAEYGVDLVLCGHTHGGQIWPFSYLVHLQQPYVRGLHVRNGTRLYLSSGTGFWGPPMRLGSTAEIALITLRARDGGRASSNSASLGEDLVHEEPGLTR